MRWLSIIVPLDDEARASKRLLLLPPLLRLQGHRTVAQTHTRRLCSSDIHVDSAEPPYDERHSRHRPPASRGPRQRLLWDGHPASLWRKSGACAEGMHPDYSDPLFPSSSLWNSLQLRGVSYSLMYKIILPSTIVHPPSPPRSWRPRSSPTIASPPQELSYQCRP